MTQELITQSKTIDNSRQDECMNFSFISDSDIMDEYIRRFTITGGMSITDAKAAADHFRGFLSEEAAKREMFIVCFMNSQNQILTTEVLFVGCLAISAVYPRQVIERVLELGAGSVMLAHNHPSGLPTPSSSDRAVTKKLQTALGAIDVDLLDHIIIGGGEHFSFADHRLI
jgi:DNA repair protein RadC